MTTITFRRSFWDFWVFIPFFLLLFAGFRFLIYLTTFIIGLFFIFLALYWVHSTMSVRYAITSEGIEIYRGRNMIRKLDWGEIRKSHIRVIGGKPGPIDTEYLYSDINIDKAPGIPHFLDISTIEFRDKNNILIGRVRGVKTRQFLDILLRYI
jgi:hypothetical protein